MLLKEELPSFDSKMMIVKNRCLGKKGRQEKKGSSSCPACKKSCVKGRGREEDTFGLIVVFFWRGFGTVRS